MKRAHGFLLAAPLFGAAGLPPQTAFAQDENAGLEEIIIKATKREASVHEIPLSVVIRFGTSIDRLGYTNLMDLASTVPNFLAGQGVTNNFISIRGFGAGSDRSFEQSVGLFVDGVYAPRSAAYRTPLFDIERVAILRGPQAALFGLNSTAGAVSVVTNKTRPGDALTLSFSGEIEAEFGSTQISAIAGGSPTPELGLRAAVEIANGGDGIYANDFTAADENSPDHQSLRLSSVWEPIDRLTVTSSLAHTTLDMDGLRGEQFGPNARDGDGTLNFIRNQDASLVPTIVANDPWIDSGPGLEQQSTDLSISVEHLLEKHTLTSVFGYADSEWSYLIDLDTTPNVLLDAGLYEAFDESSFEFRLNSLPDRRLEYISGVYYQKWNLFNSQPNAANRVPFLAPLGLLDPGFPVDIEYTSAQFDLTSETSSVFGILNWNITDNVRIGAGARYNKERKSAMRTGISAFVDDNGALRAPNPANPNDISVLSLDLIGFAGDRDDDHFLPELTVQWDVSDRSMLYARLAESAKSGGFAASTAVTMDTVEYDDEQVGGMELGLKHVLSSGAAEFNVALFRTEYDDLQVNSFNPETGSNLIENAAEVVSQGLEIEMRWRALRRINVGGSLSYLDAEYTDYDRARCPASITPPGTMSCDFSGRPTPFAPKLGASLVVDTAYSVGNELTIRALLGLRYTDEYFTDATLDPVGLQDAHSRIDASVSLHGQGNQWQVELIAKNVTDEIVLASSQPFLGYIGYLQPPRMLTLKGTFRVEN